MDGPLSHYIKQGEKEGNSPVEYFSPNWWRATYGLGSGEFKTAFENYLRNHRNTSPCDDYDFIRKSCFRNDDEYQKILKDSGRTRNGLLDFDFINRQNIGQVKAPDPICVFLRLSGEGFDVSPSPFFDPRFYLENNRDVASAGVSPFIHFIKDGLFERRKPTSFLRTKGNFAGASDKAAFLREIHHPGELFEIDAPYELDRGDFASLGNLTRPHIPANFFLGEPPIENLEDFDAMFSVYQAYMEASK
jgi:hypothetical protein